jgi:hypothetical protein
VNPRITPTLLLTAVLVASSTAVFPFVGGYGTVLFQLITLNAWATVASMTSQNFADYHHGFVLFVALVFNLLAFLIVAGPIWLACRKRNLGIGSIALGVWCVFYLACLFLLFRATDGP